MSFRWPNKDPDETIDYSVDWSRFIDTATITSAVWYVDDASSVKTLLPASGVVNGLQNISQTITGGVTTIYLGLGTNNTEYKIYCTMTDNRNSIAERVVRLKIKEQ